MWEMELKNKKGNGKIVDPVGSEENWYNKANEYWEVNFIFTSEYISNIQWSFRRI